MTVCLCTRDSPGYARLCLDSLRAQTAGPGGFDILVVDSASRAEAAAELRRLVAAMPNARLLRLERPGLSLARNAGARAAAGDYVAFIDDDAAAAPDWVERIKQAVREHDPPPAVLGGRVLPLWEAPLPAWWPASLRGVLTISEWEGGGEYRTAEVPAGLEPYGANMAVERAALLAAGGFDERLGRQPGLLLSDEDVQLAWRLQQGGRSARHDGRLVVQHRIQAGRLTPDWLLRAAVLAGRVHGGHTPAVGAPRPGLAGVPPPARRPPPVRPGGGRWCRRAARGCWRCAGGTPTRTASPAWLSAGMGPAAAGPSPGAEGQEHKGRDGRPRSARRGHRRQAFTARPPNAAGLLARRRTAASGRDPAGCKPLPPSRHSALTPFGVRTAERRSQEVGRDQGAHVRRAREARPLELLGVHAVA